MTLFDCFSDRQSRGNTCHQSFQQQLCASQLVPRSPTVSSNGVKEHAPFRQKVTQQRHSGTSDDSRDVSLVTTESELSSASPKSSRPSRYCHLSRTVNGYTSATRYTSPDARHSKLMVAATTLAKVDDLHQRERLDEGTNLVMKQIKRLYGDTESAAINLRQKTPPRRTSLDPPQTSIESDTTPLSESLDEERGPAVFRLLRPAFRNQLKRQQTHPSQDSSPATISVSDGSNERHASTNLSIKTMGSRLKLSGTSPACNGITVHPTAECLVAEPETEIADLSSPPPPLTTIVEEDLSSCTSKSTTNGSISQPTDLVDPVVETKDGHFFLKLLETELFKLEEKICEFEDEIANTHRDQDVVELLMSTIGKTRLLMGQKLDQFKSLCQKNIEGSCDTSSDPFVPTADDLTGFWDMVSFQIEDCHRNFEKLYAIRSAGWRIEDPPVAVSVSNACKQSPSSTSGPRLSSMETKVRPKKVSSSGQCSAAVAKARADARRRMREAKAMSSSSSADDADKSAMFIEL